MEATEYGGVSGIVQPPPHHAEEVPSEWGPLVVRTDPSDPLSSPESVLTAEREEADKRG
jgi:hypothetical protein